MLDLHAASVTIDSGGVSENTYKPNGLAHEPVREIYNLLVSKFPALLEEDVNEWALLGLTRKNGDNYSEDTVSVFYEGPPSSERRRRFGINDVRLLVDAHTLKFELGSGHVYIKVYAGDWWNLKLPSLPVGSCLATNFGYGEHFGKPELAHRRDAYFFHDDAAAVSDWARTVGVAQVGEVEVDLGETGLYGLQYDVRDQRPLKLKRYYQPHQPKILNRTGL